MQRKENTLTGEVAESRFNQQQKVKGVLVELTGHYFNSDKNIRKSFTCSVYELISHE